MYGPDLRTYCLSAVVSVLLGAGIGLGWHYFADSAGGRVVAAATTPLIQQDAPKLSASSAPAPAEVPVLDGPQFPGLSHYPQPAAHDGALVTVGKAAAGTTRHKMRRAGSQSDLRFKSSES
jgi:hypothetical protein